MNWAQRRQLFFLLIFLALIFILGFLFIYPLFNKEPTCYDGKKNGDELGIDCGNSCPLACVSQIQNPSILWSRSFEVVPGRHNALAYLENHNENMAVYKVKYRFRFADKNNVYLGSREGETFIPPSRKFAVFESSIDLGNSVPVYTTFEFLENLTWIQVEESKVEQLKIISSALDLSNEEDKPKLSATVKNNSLFRIPEVSFIVVLFDEKNNALAISKTYLELLKPEEIAQINFTWPKPFNKKIVTKEIIPMYNVFLANLK